MAALTSQDFLKVVSRSQLVSGDQLQAAIASLQQGNQGKLPQKSRSIAEFLISQELITKWQANQLLRGKYKGFFLGKYVLLRHLGSGGMSNVYLARHIHMGRQVAIKVLPKARLEDKSYLERFYLEAKAVATLDHPNIVRAYDIDSEGNTHYLVMEYVAGHDLQYLVQRSQHPLDYHLIADYVSQAAESLQHAHEGGLVHRDVKPANLLVDPSGVVKLLDLGLALFANDDLASLTVAHHENMLGTADYLAPEQALDSHGIDYRADIYSLGCTFYFALVGHPPFPKGSIAQRIAKHQTAEPTSIFEKRPGCPPQLIALCEQMMKKKPDERPQSASEVATLLRNWLRDNPAPLDASQATVASLAMKEGDDSSDASPSPNQTTASKILSVVPSSPPSVARETTVVIETTADSHISSSIGKASPASSSDVAVDGSSASLLQSRQQRQFRSQKSPWWIWAVLGVLTVTAMGLAIYVALR